MAPSTLDTIAEELIDQVVVLLRDERETQVLLALSRVSKKLHRIVEPHLYRVVSIPIRSDHDSLCPMSLQQFIRTLQGRKALRKYVRELTLVRRGIEGYGAESLTDMLADRLGEVLPNLQRLFMPNYPWSYNYPYSSLHRTLGTFSRHLRVAELSMPKDTCLLDFFPIFNLPSIFSVGLRRNVLLYPELEADEGTRAVWGILNSTVKHVLIDLHVPSEADMADFLAACPQLKTLNRYHEQVPQIGLRTTMHYADNELTRISYHHESINFLIYMEDQDSNASQHTPWHMPLANHSTWFGFDIFSSRGGTEELQDLISKFPIGANLLAQQWRMVYTLFVALALCGMELQKSFQDGVVIRFRTEECNDELAKAVLFVETMADRYYPQVAGEEGMLVVTWLPTPLVVEEEKPKKKSKGKFLRGLWGKIVEKLR